MDYIGNSAKRTLNHHSYKWMAVPTLLRKKNLLGTLQVLVTAGFQRLSCSGVRAASFFGKNRVENDPDLKLESLCQLILCTLQVFL